MDVLDFINRGGQKEVRNPLFNPKSKKNIVPRTITVVDLDADKSVTITTNDETLRIIPSTSDKPKNVQTFSLICSFAKLFSSALLIAIKILRRFFLSVNQTSNLKKMFYYTP